MAIDETLLRSPDGRLTAAFVPSLGMVCSSLRHDREELLAQRGGPDAYARSGSTFGIPLLHPWANRLGAWSYGTPAVLLDRASPVVHVDGATGLPSHGLLAASPLWRLLRSAAESLRAELDFSDDPALLAAFPFPHRLVYDAEIGPGALSVRLTVIPTGERPVPIAFGFHPYLTLPGSERAGWQLELPVRRRALLDDRGLPTGAHEPVVPGALDGPLAERAFDDSFDELAGGPAGPPAFAVFDERRRIALEFSAGYDVAQVYAPAGSDFICFEPMTAPVDALRSGEGLRHVAPGESFTAEFRVDVRAPDAGT